MRQNTINLSSLVSFWFQPLVTRLAEIELADDFQFNKFRLVATAKSDISWILLTQRRFAGCREKGQ